MKCFTFWENIKTTLSILVVENYGFILNTCHDTADRAETRVGLPAIFSRLWWPIEPKFSQVCYFIYKLWYTKCGPLDNTVYRKCPMALKTQNKTKLAHPLDSFGDRTSTETTHHITQHLNESDRNTPVKQLTTSPSLEQLHHVQMWLL